MDLRDKKVTVMGLGLHGGALGTITWLQSQGALVTATDLKTEEQLAPTIAKLPQSVRLALGRHDDSDFTNADLVIRNPAVPKTSPYLQLAKKAGIPIEMDSSLFFAHSPSKNIIGITGSKGKTTTANAIYHVLHAHDPNTVPVGTDGISPLGALNDITPTTRVVFELSSWRLEPLQEQRVSPPIAVVTSIYKEHLNTYTSFDEYVAVKKSIFTHQGKEGIALLNADDPIISTWQHDVPGTLLWFGLGKPTQGIGIDNGRVVISKDGTTTDILAISALPTTHSHEIRNLLPSILLAHLFGMSAPDIEKAVQSLARLPHRIEFVRELHDVRYVNDSAATMPDATIAALRATDTPVVLILGGNDKELEFEALANEISNTTVRSLVWLPGTATERMQSVICAQNPTIPSTDIASMQEAVQVAQSAAQPGDTVLLSPGATSFGLFAHEFDRGDQYKQAVAALV